MMKPVKSIVERRYRRPRGTRPASPPLTSLAAYGLLGLLVLAAVAAGGCSGAAEPKTASRSSPIVDAPPPQVSASVPSPAPAPTTTTPRRAGGDGVGDSDGGDDLTIVIDRGAEGGGDTSSLVAAARAERKRRASAGRPMVVITDDNLAEYATGEITFAAPEPVAGEPIAGDAASSAAQEEEERGEEYWSGRVRELRQRWRRSEERIEDLEAEAADLRRQFYDEDDPYVRDGQIKPAWDEAGEELRKTRVASRNAQRGLEETLEEGRLANALPGWLRAGIELEPREADDEGPVGAEKLFERLPRAFPLPPKSLGENG